MKHLDTAIWSEYMKIRKSKVLLVTIILFVFIPLMIGLMMYVSMNPGIASKLGMIGTKSKLFGENDWFGYFALLKQMLAAIGLIGFGFVTTWVFAQEHAYRTMKDILVLPVPRASIVLAKFIIVFVMCIILATVLFSVAIIVGKFIQPQGWSFELFIDFTISYFITALLTTLLCTPVAWLAGYSRGIIAPLGMVILTLIIAQFTGLVGLGPYFPWAIPGLYSVSTNAEGLRLFTSSYVILGATFILGYWATWYWWRNADHH